MYKFPEASKATIKKFRMDSAKSDQAQALIIKINDEFEIVPDTSIPEPVTHVNDLEELLPESTPRYILLSYPTTTDDGRKTTPFVMIHHRPVNATQHNRMIYVGALDLVANEAGVRKIIDIEELDEVEDLHGLVTL